MLTLAQAAEQLRTNRKTLKRLIEKKILPATQIVPGAPWEIPEESVQSSAVTDSIKSRGWPHVRDRGRKIETGNRACFQRLNKEGQNVEETETESSTRAFSRPNPRLCPLQLTRAI
jgi:excisionase family DNA binding protein